MNMRKIFGKLCITSLVLGMYFAPAISLAACSDAQVDSWLTQNKLARDGENLHQAYQALGDCSSLNTIEGLVGRVGNILNSLVPLLVGLAVFVILWGIFTYITKAGEEEKRAEAKKFILYGIIGVFIMLSLWGLVGILVNTFSINQQLDISDIPKVPEIQ